MRIPQGLHSRVITSGPLSETSTRTSIPLKHVGGSWTTVHQSWTSWASGGGGGGGHWLRWRWLTTVQLEEHVDAVSEHTSSITGPGVSTVMSVDSSWLTTVQLEHVDAVCESTSSITGPGVSTVMTRDSCAYQGLAPCHARPGHPPAHGYPQG